MCPATSKPSACLYTSSNAPGTEVYLLIVHGFVEIFTKSEKFRESMVPDFRATWCTMHRPGVSMVAEHTFVSRRGHVGSAWRRRARAETPLGRDGPRTVFAFSGLGARLRETVQITRAGRVMAEMEPVYRDIGLREVCKARKPLGGTVWTRQTNKNRRLGGVPSVQLSLCRTA